MVMTVGEAKQVSGFHLAPADRHEQAPLTLPDSTIVLLHDPIKGLPGAFGLGDHLL